MNYKEKQQMYKELYKSTGKTIWISKTSPKVKGSTYVVAEKVKGDKNGK